MGRAQKWRQRTALHEPGVARKMQPKTPPFPQSQFPVVIHGPQSYMENSRMNSFKLRTVLSITVQPGTSSLSCWDVSPPRPAPTLRAGLVLP